MEAKKRKRAGGEGLDGKPTRRSVFVWGRGGDGILGTGGNEDLHLPVEINELKDKCIIQVSCGAKHTVCVSRSGEVYSWGWNWNGQLGIDGSDRMAPTLVKSLALTKALNGTRFAAVAAGSDHTIALSKDGSVYSWGGNPDGQLGNGESGQYVHVFASKILSLHHVKVVDISCRGGHNLCLTDTGRVFAWGRGNNGRCGLGMKNGAVQYSIPAEIEGIKCIAIATGWSHSLALVLPTGQPWESPEATPRVYTWGKGIDGMLGIGGDEENQPADQYSPVEVAWFTDNNVQITQIAGGYYHSAAIDNKGNLFTWGWGEYGQLGHGTLENQYVPKQVHFPEPHKIVQVDCGGFHTIALTDDGRCYAFGLGDFGQLGLKEENKNEGIGLGNAEAVVSVPTSVLEVTNGVMASPPIPSPMPPRTFTSGFLANFHVKDAISLADSTKDRPLVKSFSVVHPVSSPITFLPTPRERVLSHSLPNRYISSCGMQTFCSSSITTSHAFSPFNASLNETAEQNGAPPPTVVPTPSLIPSLVDKNVESISCGWWHTVAIIQNKPKPILKTDTTNNLNNLEESRSMFSASLLPDLDGESSIRLGLEEPKMEDLDKELLEIQKIISTPPSTVTEATTPPEALPNFATFNAKPTDTTADPFSTNTPLLPDPPPVEISFMEKFATYLANVFFVSELHQQTVLINRRNTKSREEQKKLRENQYLQNNIEKTEEIWKEEILPNWERSKYLPRTQQLWLSGIPVSVRGGVWKRAIGNKLNIDSNTFETCRNKAKAVRNTDLDENQFFRLIEVDVPRTFVSTELFKKGGAYYDQLMIVLETYATFKPEIGYVQGMSYLAAVLLLYNDACSTFICFANLVENHFFKSLFKMELKQILRHMKVYDLLFQYNLPKLHQRFHELTISPEQYLLNWFLTMFSSTLSIPLASRIWDCYFYYGEVFLFQTALGILLAHKKFLMKADFEECVCSLRRLAEDMQEELLFKSIKEITVPPTVHLFVSKLNSIEEDLK